MCVITHSVCNYADDTTPHVCDEVEQVLIRLEHDSAIAICWFESNYMKLNTTNCHLLISGNKNEYMWAKVGNDKIWESNTVKLLGITIDNHLKFNEHVATEYMQESQQKTICFIQNEQLFKF